MNEVLDIVALLRQLQDLKILSKAVLTKRQSLLALFQRDMQINADSSEVDLKRISA